MPSTSYFLNLLKKEKKIFIKVNNKKLEKIIFFINLNNLIKLAKFKFPKQNIKFSVLLI
jgi:hypothetical protein